MSLPDTILVAAITASFSLVIGFISAVVAVRFALRRFGSEKRWELKHKAYSEILQTLQAVLSMQRHDLLEQRSGRSETREDGAKRIDGYDELLREIQRVVEIGRFVIHDEAVSRLEAYRENHGYGGKGQRSSSSQRLEKEMIDTEVCIDDLVGIGRKDLDTTLKRW